MFEADISSWKNKVENLALYAMRNWACLLLLLFISGCESAEDAYVPGRIPRETAIAIASRANHQYPYPLSKVTRATWRAAEGYWAIDFRDQDERYGKFYLVDGEGHIVGEGNIQGNNYF